MECTLSEVLSGGCSLWEMMTGDVLVGLLQTVVAIGAVWVAIWQIRKQERLTREQIQATMEATQKQLEEMAKAAQPEIDIIFTKQEEIDNSVIVVDEINGKFVIDRLVCIEVFNTKNIPVYVRGHSIEIKWYPTVGDVRIANYTSKGFKVIGYDNDRWYPYYINISTTRNFRLDFLISSDERKVLRTGESYKINIRRRVFDMIVDPELLKELDLRLEELKSAEVVITFDIPGIDAEARFTFTVSDKLSIRPGRFRYVFYVFGEAFPKGNKIEFKMVEKRKYEEKKELTVDIDWWKYGVMPPETFEKKRMPELVEMLEALESLEETLLKLDEELDQRHKTFRPEEFIFNEDKFKKWNEEGRKLYDKRNRVSDMYERLKQRIEETLIEEEWTEDKLNKWLEEQRQIAETLEMNAADEAEE